MPECQGAAIQVAPFAFTPSLGLSRKHSLKELFMSIASLSYCCLDLRCGLMAFSIA